LEKVSQVGNKMKLNHFKEVSQYYEHVKSYLLQHEAQHNLIFGILDGLINQPERFKHSPYLVTVEEDNRLLAVALWTPPRKLVLSRSLHPQALNIIAQDLQARQAVIPGVTGLVDEALAFAQAWQAITNQSYHQSMQLRVYQLETIQPIAKANGYFRQATQADRNVLIEWVQAFSQEALDEATEYDEAEQMIERYLRKGSLYLWQDQVPVATAGYGGATPNGIRVNFVYTSPKYRRQGYATSCVAALSQTLLDQGLMYCFLFTDLANPTSNHIYQAIGYQPVCDMDEYSFQG
jgi:predicted GNAT family acetyltransferase